MEIAQTFTLNWSASVIRGNVVNDEELGCANPRQFLKMLLASGSCGAPWYENHKYINDF